MTDSISQDKYSKELIKLDFPEKLIGSPETCRNLLEYCKKHDMKYLKKSDGLLVNTKFDKHFKVSECIKMRNKLSRKGHLYDKEDIKLPLENINLLRSKTEEKVFILISSPLEDMFVLIFWIIMLSLKKVQDKKRRSIMLLQMRNNHKFSM